MTITDIIAKTLHEHCASTRPHTWAVHRPEAQAVLEAIDARARMKLAESKRVAKERQKAATATAERMAWEDRFHKTVARLKTMQLERDEWVVRHDALVQRVTLAAVSRRFAADCLAQITTPGLLEQAGGEHTETTRKG